MRASEVDRATFGRFRSEEFKIEQWVQCNSVEHGGPIYSQTAPQPRSYSIREHNSYKVFWITAITPNPPIKVMCGRCHEIVLRRAMRYGEQKCRRINWAATLAGWVNVQVIVDTLALEVDFKDNLVILSSWQLRENKGAREGRSVIHVDGWTKRFSSLNIHGCVESVVGRKLRHGNFPVPISVILR